METADKVAGRVFITTSRRPMSSRPASRSSSLPRTATAESIGSGERRGRVGAMWLHSKVTRSQYNSLSTQSLHQLGGGVLPAEQGAVHRGGIVNADGLARQVKPVADRLLQPAPVVKTRAGRVERVAAARIGVGAPTRCPDLGEGQGRRRTVVERWAARRPSGRWGGRLHGPA